MQLPIGRDLHILALVLLVACASSGPPSPAPSPEGSVTVPPTTDVSSADEASGAPVLVRLTVLDTNARVPKHLPGDRSFVRGANTVLAAVAHCRAETQSSAHWVEIEWHVDAAGKVLKTVAHPVFIMPEGQPPAIEDATLRCIEQRAGSPPFTAASGQPVARTFALIGFDLPEGTSGELAPGVPFFPEPDGHCRVAAECPAEKMCEQPPRVRCPRASNPGAQRVVADD